MQRFFLYLFKCSYHKYKLNIEQQRAQNLSQQIQNTEYSTLDHRLDLLGAGGGGGGGGGGSILICYNKILLLYTEQ